MDKSNIIVTSILISIILAIGSIWSLHEDDIFWQIRAGQEILATFTVQTRDSWSYTANGKEWINYQWLSDIVFYFIYHVTGIVGLIFSRVLLIFLWFLLICMSIKSLDINPYSKLFTILIFIPIAYIGSIFRLHLRPETFSIIIFTIQYILYLKGNSSKRNLLWQPILVIISANFHGGTAIFNLFAAVIFLFEANIIIKEKLFFICISLIAIFLTPVHFYIAKQIFLHSQYDTNLLFNKEWQSFSWGLLNIYRQGLAFVSFFIILICGWAAIIHTKKETAILIICALFTVLSFMYIRVIPYIIILLIPIIAQEIEKLSFQYKKQTLGVLSGLVILILLPSQINKFSYRWDLGINSDLFPVTPTNFIASHKPEKELFSDMQGHSYTLFFLPQYKSYIDHRDIPFNSIKSEYIKANNDPIFFKQVASKYDINAVLNTYTIGTIHPSGQTSDPISSFYPKDQWGLVYFTNTYVLLYKKISAHKEILDQFEYKFLNPALPASVYIFSDPTRDKVDNILFEKELSRCLMDEPRNILCNSIKAGKLIQTKDPLKVKEGVVILEMLNHGTTKEKLDFHYYTLLWQGYTYLKDVNMVKTIEDKINSLIK